MKVKIESEVAQLCPTLSDPANCSLPGSSIHGIFQARVLEWGAIAFSNEKGIVLHFGRRHITLRSGGLMAFSHGPKGLQFPAGMQSPYGWAGEKSLPSSCLMCCGAGSLRQAGGH